MRVGVDIGGTFTDVAVEADGGGRWSVKVPTTHGAPEDGVLAALERGLAAAGATLADVTLLVHGTTLATNALIERKGAVTGLITTEGFRDVLEMGNEGRFDQYDLRITRPMPLVPRHLRLGVPARLRHDGSVVEPLDEAAVRRAAGVLRDAGVEAVAVVFLHAYANGGPETRARALLAAELPGVALSVSHEVSPEMREYERTSTTVANAYLQPLVGSYLLRLEARLQAQGLAGPMLMILSSGSLTTVATAARVPVRLLESGPAGGAIFAADVARRLGLDRVLSLDVGGTTAKFCMIDKGEPHHALAFEVGRTYRFKKGSGLPVRVPVVDLVEIGAGGGSIARLDAVGRVVVGPDSAGSEPGPACYGRGGTLPTVTDCDLLQGKLDAPGFAGGTMPLDIAAAQRAVARHIGGPAGLPVTAAAWAVTESVTESMAAAARVHAAEVGATPEARTLVAFGGGAPLHAARFAEKLGIAEILVPTGAGVGSAIGFLRAPVAYELVRTVRLRLPGGELEPVRAALAAMGDEAAGVIGGGDLMVRRSAMMRYAGQGHDVEVALPGDPGAAAFGDDLRGAFDAAYAGLYGRALDGAAEVSAWIVRVQQRQSAAPPAAARPPAHDPAATGRRLVLDGAADRWHEWLVYEHDRLNAGAAAAGPAIVAEAETTTVVPPGWRFAVDGDLNLRLTRTAA